MCYDFSTFFQEYENLVTEVDKLFQKVQEACPDEVKCKSGCVDCCYAMFDLSLIEAMYINKKFHTVLSEKVKQEVLKHADYAERQSYKIKRRAYKSRQKGEDTDKILQDIGKEKVKCPLLSDNNTCLLYEYRPINCRLYGIPIYTGDQVHTCTKSGFKSGEKYPTVYMDKIYDRLFDINKRIVESIPTKHIKLAEVLVPVSMALINEYNEEYLGIIEPKEQNSSLKAPKEWVIGQGG